MSAGGPAGAASSRGARRCAPKISATRARRGRRSRRSRSTSCAPAARRPSSSRRSSGTSRCRSTWRGAGAARRCGSSSTRRARRCRAARRSPPRAASSGLKLLSEAREGGHVGRFHAEERAGVDARAVAGEGLVLHDVDAGTPKVGTPTHVLQFGFHTTLTFLGGSPEQDLRSILADPRGPSFDFWEADERRRAHLEPGFPDGLHARARRSRRTVERGAGLARARARAARRQVAEARRRGARARPGAALRVLPDAHPGGARSPPAPAHRGRRGRGAVDRGGAQARVGPAHEGGARALRAVDRDPPVGDRGDRPPAAGSALSAHAARASRSARSRSRSTSRAAPSCRPPCPHCGRPAGEFWWGRTGLVCRRCRGRAGKPGSRGRKGS